MEINRNNYEAWFLDYIEGNLSAEREAMLLLFLEHNPDLKQELEGFEMISLSDDQPSFELKDTLKKTDEKTLERFESLSIGSLENINSAEESDELNRMLKEMPALEKELLQFYKTKIQAESVSLDEKELYLKNTSLFQSAASNRDLLIIGLLEGWFTESENKKIEKHCKENAELGALLSAYSKTKLSKEEVVFSDKNSLYKKEGKIVVFQRSTLYRIFAAAAVVTLIFTLWPKQDEYKNELSAQKKNNTIPREDNKDSLPMNTTEWSTENNQFAESNSIRAKQNPINKHQQVAVNENPIQEIANEDRKELKDTIITTHSPQENVAQQNNPKDSAAVNVQQTTEDLALQNNANSNDEFMSVGEYLKKKTNEKLFGKEEVNKNDVQQSISNTASKITGTNVAFASNAGDEYKETYFEIGKFSFQRKTKK